MDKLFEAFLLTGIIICAGMVVATTLELVLYGLIKLYNYHSDRKFEKRFKRRNW